MVAVRRAAEDLLDSVRSLAPLVAAERAALNRRRELSPRLAAALIDAGLFRLWAPRQLGGAELEPVAGLEVLAALSALDGSVGWNAMIASAYTFFAGRLPERAAKRIFGSRGAVVAGQLEPGGKAEPIRGGYRVSGRWPFGSGSKQATWFLAHCVVRDPSRGRGAVAGRPEIRLVFVPAAQCRIHDTWRVSGLRGTGSHDYSMKNVDVPAEYCVDVLADQPTRPEPLYAFPVITFVTAAVAAVPIGIARAALQAFIELARTKRSFGSAQPLSEHPTAQRELGRAALHLRSAEALLFRVVEDMWATVKRGKPPTLEQRAEVRTGCVNAGVSAAQAVDVVYGLAGSSSIFERSPLERCFRDVHTATQHVALAPRTLEVVGRVLFGMEPQGLL
ncbi:MAG TPA: acyl-CoA dehydrogenase family protein [Candidatus Dormibacteraeota bacterium]|nr:acyl-CoA dehydrogenase family protein [Candidatus Dormibacteraeota bacterium]